MSTPLAAADGAAAWLTIPRNGDAAARRRVRRAADRAHVRPGVGSPPAVTASTMRALKASSVPENLSGEYVHTHSVSG